MSPVVATGVANVHKRLLIQFSASEAFMAKVEKVRSLAWHRLPANASFEQVFELALDIMIEREDPERRAARRAQRAERGARVQSSESGDRSVPKESTHR